MRSKRRILVGLGVGAAAVVLLVVELAVRAPLPDVTVVPVTRQTLESWVSTNGTVQPKQADLLQSRLDTFVTKVGVLEGQAVRKGQPLLSLDSTPDTAQLAQAHLQLLTAERQLQDARAGGPPDQVAQLNSELTKAEASRDQLAAEQKALEQLVASRAATQDELARNGLKLSQAEADVKFYQQHKSVVDGTVYALPARQGQFVHVGDELAAVADLHEVRVMAYVDEMDLGSLETNQFVQIQWDAIPGRVWTGRTELIPKQVVPYKDRSVGEVLCSIANTDLRLLPNTHVDVRIRVEQRAASLVVPRAAVQGIGADKYVYVYRDGRLQKQAIQVGIDSKSRFEVLGGLKEGDLVAIPGAVNLTDGLQVHPIEAR